jgi:uncharacterized membrane protein YhaH (DUF805 family)
MDYGDLLFSFSGRVNRAKFWLVSLIWGCIWLLLTIVAGFVASVVGPLGAIPLLIVFTPAIISSIAIGIRRLHDRDKGGWWILPLFVAPLILGQLGPHMDGAGPILSLAAIALSIWAVVELGCLRGTGGPNQYGPDPLGGTAQQPA